MRKHLLAFSFAMIASTAAAAAQATMTSHDKAAVEFLEAIGIERIISEISAALANSLIRTNPPLAPHRDVIIAWSNKYVTWEAAAPELIKTYTKTFTEPELREITSFYGTPAGRKMAAHLPGLMESAAAAGGRLAGAHIADLQKMLQEQNNMQPGSGQPPKSP